MRASLLPKYIAIMLAFDVMSIAQFTCLSGSTQDYALGQGFSQRFRLGLPILNPPFTSVEDHPDVEATDFGFQTFVVPAP